MRVWSLCTTVRSPERLLTFLQAFQEVNTGQEWDGHKRQRLYAHLVRSRIIKPHLKGLPNLLQAKLKKPDYPLTPDDMWMLLEYRSPKSMNAIIGNTLSLLCRWRMIEEIPGAPDSSGKSYQITSEGQALLAGTLPLQVHMMQNLLRWKFPIEDDFKVMNVQYRPVRPYVCTLALIMEVNRQCRKQGLPEVGLWRDEFDLFALTMIASERVAYHAECVLQYRATVTENPDKDEQQKDLDYSALIDRFEKAGYSGIRSAADYTDVIFRFFAQSKYFLFSTDRHRIDINPVYEDEIKKIVRLLLHK